MCGGGRYGNFPIPVPRMLPLVLATLVVALAGPPVASPPACSAPSGASATVLVPDTPALASAHGPLTPGDVVAVYVGDACVGSSVWNGQGLAISVWEDDPFTAQPDGFVEGAAFEIRTWSAASGTTAVAEVVFEEGYSDADGLRADALYLVAPTGSEASLSVWISEMDADPESAFVEILAEAPWSDLPEVTLVAVNAQGVAYGALDLGGMPASAAATVTVRPEGTGTGVAMPGVAAFEIGPAAFALYPTVSAPAVGQPVASFAAIDAFVYKRNGMVLPDGLLASLGRRVGFVDAPGASLARLAGTAIGTESLAYAATPTPGTSNDATFKILMPDTPGLRLTSLPVLSGASEAFTVEDLGQLGPISGVPGSGAPEADPTVWTRVDDAGGYQPAPSVSVALAPGAGFLWDWSAPAEAAKSGAPTRRAVRTSASLQKTSTSLQMVGLPLDDAATGGPLLRALGEVPANGHALIGNPYAYPFQLSGLSLQGSASMQSALATWDPVEQTYVNLFARPEAPELAGVLPVWGGALAEVTGGGALVVSTTSTHVVPGAASGGEAPAGIAFHLRGTLAGGAVTADRAAHVVFVDGATPGWDTHDASKLTPPVSEHALVAAVGVRDGAAHRQRVLSLPAAASPQGRLAFTATSAGTFTLSWDASIALEGVVLVDLDAGTEVPLHAASEYDFATDAAVSWTERFELRAGATEAEAGPSENEVHIGEPYPNPTASVSSIRLHAGLAQAVQVDVVDALGRRVGRYAAALEAGVPTTLSLEARQLAPGTYLAVVRGETFAETRRLTVAR